MNTLILILAQLVKLLLPVLLKNTQPSCVDAAPQSELTQRLRAKIRCTWIVWPLVFMLAGCGQRTIYVPDGTPVRLRETVKNVKVWVKDDAGNTSASRMDLPEGWYCLADE